MPLESDVHWPVVEFQILIVMSCAADAVDFHLATRQLNKQSHYDPGGYEDMDPNLSLKLAPLVPEPVSPSYNTSS